MELEKLISVLEISVKRNGEKPLTNLWLLNILKLAKKEIEQEEEMAEQVSTSKDWMWK